MKRFPLRPMIRRILRGTARVGRLEVERKSLAQVGKGRHRPDILTEIRRHLEEYPLQGSGFSVTTLENIAPEEKKGLGPKLVLLYMIRRHVQSKAPYSVDELHRLLSKKSLAPKKRSEFVSKWLLPLKEVGMVTRLPGKNMDTLHLELGNFPRNSG